MDSITLRELEVHFRVGVPAEERAQAQRLLVTVTMTLDFAPAVRSGSISETIDYAQVAERIRHLGQGREWVLIESLAADIANAILNEFRPRSVFVEVQKFIIPEARYVAVSLTRERPA